VYEDNAMKLVGRDNVALGFASLARLTERVEVKFEAPVVLGATGRIDRVLDDLKDTPNLQVGALAAAAGGGLQ
jgi:Asp/Glu/hydantoin racemase